MSVVDQSHEQLACTGSRMFRTGETQPKLRSTPKRDLNAWISTEMYESDHSDEHGVAYRCWCRRMDDQEPTCLRTDE
jgi:hypothetical protein